MITKILNKYRANRNYYFPDTQKAVYESTDKLNEIENELQEKWKDHIPPRWYGFALAPCPESWLYIIDEFLDYLLTLDPNFKIHQIKIKFGEIRFYVDYEIADEELAEFIRLQIEKLEWTLFDTKLIY